MNSKIYFSKWKERKIIMILIKRVKLYRYKMKIRNIALWQLCFSVILLVIFEAVYPYFKELSGTTYDQTYELVFILIMYIFGGIILSLSKLKYKAKFKLTLRNLIISFVLLVVIIVWSYFKFNVLYSFVILKILALCFGFIFLPFNMESDKGEVQS